MPQKSTLTLAEALASDVPDKERALLAEVAREAGVRSVVRGNGAWDARNRAARAGTAPALLFVNGDIELVPGAWEAAAAALGTDRLGVLGGMPMYDEGFAPPNADVPCVMSAGYCFGPRHVPYARFCTWRPDHPKLFPRDDLQAVPCSLMAARRHLFRTLGGFREEAYGDLPFADVELCLLAKAQGFSVAFEPAFAGLAGPEPMALTQEHLRRGIMVFQTRTQPLIRYDEFYLL